MEEKRTASRSSTDLFKPYPSVTLVAVLPPIHRGLLELASVDERAVQETANLVGIVEPVHGPCSPLVRSLYLDPAISVRIDLTATKSEVSL